MKCCKTCKFWEREMAKDKGGRIRADKVAPCLFVMPKLPESYVNFRTSRKIELRWMSVDSGKYCEVYESI